MNKIPLSEGQQHAPCFCATWRCACLLLRQSCLHQQLHKKKLADWNILLTSSSLLYIHLMENIYRPHIGCTAFIKTQQNYHICITYCKSIHMTMMRTHPITHNTSTVAAVCCLWLVATTASRSACSHLIPIKPGWHLQHGWDVKLGIYVQYSK